VAEERMPDGDRDASERSLRVEAEQYRALGQELHAAGDVEDAAAYYQMSVDLYPTAEAYTYLGVALAARGQWSDAIVQCERAIRIDPELGNAYNDLAVYTAELGRLHEALHWLDKAIAAKKYDCRNYPYYHRGRILEQLGRFTEARDAFMTSLEIEPDWEPARVALRRVLGWLN
jgi:tetratricopeptide (TPR) repeat protein